MAEHESKKPKYNLNKIVFGLVVIGLVVIVAGLLFPVQPLWQIGVILFALGIIIYAAKRLFLGESPVLQ
jgi:hypothetical protein